MINLLPENAKKEIIAARSNIVLLRYMIILGFGVVFLAFISAGVYVVLTTTKASAESIVTDNSSKNNSYTVIKAQGDSLRASLASAKAVLDKEIAYTKLITGVAAVIPSGVVIEALSIGPSTFTGPVSLQVYAKSTEDALKMKDNLQKSSLFSNPTFVTLSSNASGQASEYPISAVISVTINKAAVK